MSTEASFRQIGAELISVSLDKMLSHADDVRDGADIEAVHDMRVASRRLRAAISVFAPAFRGRRFEKFEREVKAVTDALGEARDLDVMIDALEKLEQDIPAGERRGIDSFVAEKRELRAGLQQEVERALNRLDKRDLRARFARIVAEQDDHPAPAREE